MVQIISGKSPMLQRPFRIPKGDEAQDPALSGPFIRGTRSAASRRQWQDPAGMTFPKIYGLPSGKLT